MLQLHRFAFALLVGMLVELAEQEIQKRIYRGEPTTSWDYPFIVSIKRKAGGHSCGGSIISVNTIITAAHCSPFEKLVAGGVYKEDQPDQRNIWLHTVKWIKVHENYTKINDLAIARINGEFNFGPTIMAITLSSDTFIPSGTKVKIVGWGHRVESGEGSVDSAEYNYPLQMANMKVTSSEQCRKVFMSFVVNLSVCVHGVRKIMPCAGDSGGPMVIDNILVGVASRGYDCGTGAPALYVLVGPYMDWIGRNAGAKELL